MELKWRLDAPRTEGAQAPMMRVTANISAPWGDLSLESPRRPMILMIGDQDSHGETLRVLTEDNGHHVITQSGVSEGLEMLGQTSVDLVVLNMLLSDGMEFCRRFRANQRTDLMPVLMLSPCGTVEDEVAGIGSGADEFLGQAFSPGPSSGTDRAHAST